MELVVCFVCIFKEELIRVYSGAMLSDYGDSGHRICFPSILYYSIEAGKLGT